MSPSKQTTDDATLLELTLFEVKKVIVGQERVVGRMIVALLARGSPRSSVGAANVVRFTNVARLDVVAPKRPGWRRHLPAGLWLVALTLLVVGFARPVREVRVARDRAAVVVAIDASVDGGHRRRSVSGRGGQGRGTRLRRAAPRERRPRPGDLQRHGGLRVVQRGSAGRDRRHRESRAVGVHRHRRSHFAGLDLVASVPPAEDGSAAPGRMVVLSDGDTTAGRGNEEAAEAADGNGVPVDTIAFGTPDGGPGYAATFSQITFDDPPGCMVTP